VRSIEASAHREQRERLAHIVAERQAARRSELRRALGEERRAARARELDAREALLARVLARVRERFAQTGGTEAYRQWLTAAGEDVLSYLDAVPCRLRCRAADAPILGALAAARPDVTICEDASAGPGLVAEALDGSVTIDQTLDARLARLGGRLAIDLIAEVNRGEA